MEAWRDLHPFQSRYHALAGGVRMHYVDEGEGDEAVLMLHGNPTWGFMFRDFVKALSGKIRCVVPDHVGMGLSDKPQNYAYTLQQRAEDVTSLVASLGLKRVHLLVHDWGGAIGFGFARRKPELTGHIAITNTGAFPDSHIPARIAVCRWPLLGPVIMRGFNGFARAAVSMAVTKPMPAAVCEGYLAPYGSWADRVAVNAFVRDIPMKPNHRSYAELAAIEESLSQFRDRRILIAWGEHDFCFTTHFRDRWREIYPEAEVVSLPGVGHYLFEDAADVLVPRISDFLAGT